MTSTGREEGVYKTLINFPDGCGCIRGTVVLDFSYCGRPQKLLLCLQITMKLGHFYCKRAYLF